MAAKASNGAMRRRCCPRARSSPSCRATPARPAPSKAGAFGSIPARTNHYAMAQTPVILQIHGEGPFDLTYVNPDDDPQKAASKQ